MTYDGLEDPLGQSQVRPYVEGLARRGHRFEIVSFEKPGVPLRWRQRLGDGIRWTVLRYHKWPSLPASGFDMCQGLAATAVSAILHRADLLHVRSYVPAALALPWAIAARIPLLFDMRGLWPDEKVEGGDWAGGGRTYRTAKQVERVLLRQADSIAVLTHSTRDYLRLEYPHRAEIAAPIHVIPTCTDLERFTPQVRPDQALAARLRGARVLTYVGSLGTWYMTEAMSRFYLAWRAAVRSETPNLSPTRFLVISRSTPDAIRSVLETAGVAGELVHCSAHHQDVPAAARWAEAAICLIRPTFSKRGSAPTKLGEMLACGIPVAANIVGDMALVLRETTAGVVVDDMSDEGLARAARHLVAVASRADASSLARELAERWFSLKAGLDVYDRVYRRLPRTHGRLSSAEDGDWPASPGEPTTTTC